MELGIFARHFDRPNLDGILDAVQAHGLTAVQFNMICVGLPDMPDAVPDELLPAIRQAHADRGILMASLSGTFNMIHPDLLERQRGLDRLSVLIRASQALGAGCITLCTGTRHPTNMWRRHPDNDSPQAWADLCHTLAAALEMAQAHRVILAFEPEVANVVDSAQKGRRLLDEMGSPWLKVVMDGANIFHLGELAHQHAVLDEAFDLLGADIILAHAKDLTRDGHAGNVAAGKGLLDYAYYIDLLRSAGYAGPLIMHGLTEAEVVETVAFLRARLAA